MCFTEREGDFLSHTRDPFLTLKGKKTLFESSAGDKISISCILRLLAFCFYPMGMKRENHKTTNTSKVIQMKRAICQFPDKVAS